MALRWTVVVSAAAMLVWSVGAASVQAANFPLPDREIQSKPCESVRLPAGYLTAPGIGSYKLYSDPQPWQQANETCALDGGYLAIPDDKDELDLIMRLRRGVDYIYIGFTNCCAANKFDSALGSPMNEYQHTLWYSGHPKTSAVKYALVLHSGGKMWEIQSTDKHPFMCELAYK